MMVSGLAPGATPASNRRRLVAVYVHLNVDNCVCQVVTRTASGALVFAAIAQCGSTLYWYAYHPVNFCLSVIPHVTLPLLS